MEVDREQFEQMQRQVRAIAGTGNKNLPVNKNIKAFQRAADDESRKSILQAKGLDPDGPLPMVDRNWPKALHRQGECAVNDKKEQRAMEKQGYRVRMLLDDKGQMVTPKEFPKDMDRPKEMSCKNETELKTAKKAGWLDAPYVAPEDQELTA